MDEKGGLLEEILARYVRISVFAEVGWSKVY